MSRRRARKRASPTTLLVVGDTRYSGHDGNWHTLLALSKQLDVWFAEFDHVIIAAHRRPGDPPSFHRRLQHQDIEFVELRDAGGAGARAKLGVLTAAWSWIRVLVPLLRRSTAVHLRSPCNVTLVAIPLSWALAPFRYAIYADNWEPLGVEPMSYRLQRRALRYFGGVVHAYVPPGTRLPASIRPNVSPSFTEEELDRLDGEAQRRIDRLRSDPVAARELRVCTIGSFSTRKNQSAVIHAVADLRRRGVDVRLRLAGAGPMLESDRALAERLDLGDVVEFLGHVGNDAVAELLSWADVNVLVGRAEGFGKVFLEGMAFGCPAVTGPGEMQRSIVGDGVRGRQADPSDPTDIADALVELRDLTVDQQLEMVRSCRRYVGGFTTEAFAREIHTIVRDLWGLPAPVRPLSPR